MSSETSNVAPPVALTIGLTEAELNVLRQLVKDDYRKSLRYGDKMLVKLGSAFNPHQGYARARRLAELHSKLGGSRADLIVVKTP